MTNGVENPSAKRRGPLTLLMTSRKFRRWFAAALIGLPLLYVASLGPVCWWKARDFDNLQKKNFDGLIVSPVYFPLGWLIHHYGATLAGGLLTRWVEVGMQPGEIVLVPFGTGPGDVTSVMRLDPDKLWSQYLEGEPSLETAPEVGNEQNSGSPE